MISLLCYLLFISSSHILQHVLICLSAKENACLTVYKYQFVLVQCFTISIYKGPVGPLVMNAYERETKKESECLACVWEGEREFVQSFWSTADQYWIKTVSCPNACSRQLPFHYLTALNSICIFLLYSSFPALLSNLLCHPLSSDPYHNAVYMSPSLSDTV